MMDVMLVCARLKCHSKPQYTTTPKKTENGSQSGSLSDAQMDVALTRLHRNHLLHGHRFRRSFHVVAYPSHHGNCPAQSVQPLWALPRNSHSTACGTMSRATVARMTFNVSVWYRMESPYSPCFAMSTFFIFAFVIIR